VRKSCPPLSKYTDTRQLHAFGSKLPVSSSVERPLRAELRAEPRAELRADWGCDAEPGFPPHRPPWGAGRGRSRSQTATTLPLGQMATAVTP
jgi:hypothetical protein